MIVLDTNVVSESMRPRPDASVRAWMDAQIPSDLHTTAINEAELRIGAALLPKGNRRNDLLLAINTALARHFADRIVAFDSAAAVAFADIVEHRRSIGRPISQFDGQIAAICKSRGATLATRNIADFSDVGLNVINPWSAP